MKIKLIKYWLKKVDINNPHYNYKVHQLGKLYLSLLEIFASPTVFFPCEVSKGTVKILISPNFNQSAENAGMIFVREPMKGMSFL